MQRRNFIRILAGCLTGTTKAFAKLVQTFQGKPKTPYSELCKSHGLPVFDPITKTPVLPAQPDQFDRLPVGLYFIPGIITRDIVYDSSMDIFHKNSRCVFAVRVRRDYPSPKDRPASQLMLVREDGNIVIGQWVKV